jgi:thiamine kinase-like enzyme
MRHRESGEIRLIDFEYGGTNYAAFDIANHLNEHAGGTSAEENGIPDYSKFPNLDRQLGFCLEYVRTSRAILSGGVVGAGDVDDGADDDVCAEANDLLEQVQKFLLVNHLYWGLWAINQAAVEGCDEFDYLNFATSRINEFRARKEDMARTGTGK